MSSSEWVEREHVERYLAHADAFPHRAEGEAVLLDQVPLEVSRILDVGTGDGRLIARLRADRPASRCVALDVSEPMLDRARSRFADVPVELVKHDLSESLPDLGRFDCVVSSFAIHHLEDERKRSIYAEIFRMLDPGGVFANLEHVASPTPRLHRRFYEALGYPADWEDPSNRLGSVESQLSWLREAGFDDVDCYWKWLEMALLVGVKPER